MYKSIGGKSMKALIGLLIIIGFIISGFIWKL